MSFIETLGDACSSFKIRREFPELNRLALAMLVVKSLSHIRKHGSIIDGHPLPKSEPAIIVSNHRDENDNYKMTAVTIRTERLIRAVIKKGLVVKGCQESTEFFKSIEAEDELDYNPLTAFVLRGVGTISVDREHPEGRLFLEQTDLILKSGQLLGLFIQAHRYKDGTLKYLQTGSAFLARRNPNTLVFPCASSGQPDDTDKLTVLKPFTYNQLQTDYNRKLSPGEITIIIADKIAAGLPDRPRNEWLNRGREIEIARLSPKKKPQ